MFGLLTHSLQQIPFWAVVLLPALLFGLISYLLTKKAKFSLSITLLALAAAWLSAGFHLWETYLGRHFIGGYDQYGLPSTFSRSGWYLLIDASPLWLIPALTLTLISLLAYRYLKPATKRVTATPKAQLIQGNTSREVSQQLQIEQLQQQTARLEEKLIHEKKRMQEYIHYLEDDLQRANALIEKILARQQQQQTSTHSH